MPEFNQPVIPNNKTTIYGKSFENQMFSDSGSDVLWRETMLKGINVIESIQPYYKSIELLTTRDDDLIENKINRMMWRRDIKFKPLLSHPIAEVNIL